MTPTARALAALAVPLAALSLPAALLAHGSTPEAPEFPGVLAAWSFNPVTTIGLALITLGYVWLVRRVDAAHPRTPVPRRRVGFFLAGVGVLAVALLSPIERYESALFSVHMTQHMLLEFVAAPLLLLGAPMTLALRAATPSVRRGLLWGLRSRLVHALSFPIVGWVVFAAVNWFWHFSPLYDQALENEPLHYFQHATFIGASLLFWAPVIAVDPMRWRLPHPVRLLYLFLAMPQNSFLGLAIYSVGSVLYPHYASNRLGWAPDPMDDQRLGGVIMWVGGDAAFLLGMAIVAVAWMRHEERRTRRMDARLDAEARRGLDGDAAPLGP